MALKQKDILKKIRDGMPEFLKLLFGGMIRRKLIQHPDFESTYQLLCRRDNMSDLEITQYQKAELKKVLEYAYQYVPYYKDLFDSIQFDPAKFDDIKELERIPFIDKHIIRRNFDRLQSVIPVPGGSYIATTGGSTGEPLKVLLDYSSVFKENAFIYFFRKKLGYTFTDRLITFRGVEFGNKLWKYNPMHNELLLSPFRLSAITLPHYLKKAESYKPDYINGYLSIIYYFAKLMEAANIIPVFRLKGIFLISENIEDEKRTFIESFFGAPSFTFFGHSERCIISPEVVKGSYAIEPFYGYTELIPTEGGQFELAGTGFLNRTMPLIRYRTGDMCEKNEDGTFTIEGRWNVNDFLIGLNGEKVFHSSFNFHSEIFRNVLNYQFIQKEKGKAVLSLIVNSNFVETEMLAMRREIDRKIKGIIEFDIQVVDELKLTSRGKTKMFISEIPNE